MSLTNIEQVMPVKLAQALANPLFPALDSALRSGRHIGLDELDNHAFLMDFQEYTEEFYARYNVELIRAPEGFFYLRPRSTTLIPRSVLSELDMMVGKILCYLYLSPERLANEGIFTQQELYDELLTLADEAKLLKLVNNRSTGSDVDRQKLQEKGAFFFKPPASFGHGMVYGPRQQQIPHYRIGLPLWRGCPCRRRSSRGAASSHPRRGSDAH